MNVAISTKTNTENQRLFDGILKRIEKRKEEINALVKTNALESSENELPAEDDKLKHYTDWIRDDYEALTSNIQSVVLPEYQKADAGIKYFGLKETLKKMNDELGVLRKSMVNKKRSWMDNKVKDVYDWSNYQIRGSLLVLLALGEIAFNTYSLMVIGDSIILSALFSISLTAGLLAFSKVARKWFYNATSNSKRTIRMALSGALLVLVFLGLGIFRYLSVSEGSVIDDFLGLVSIPLFMVINIIIYVGIYYYDSQLPTPKQRQAHKEVNDLKNEYEIAKQLFEAKKDAIEEHEENTPQIISGQLERIQFYNAIVKTINQEFHASVSLWKRLLIKWAHKVPNCFNDDVPSLKCEFISMNSNDDINSDNQ
jgi:hypothetical protein